MFKYALYLQYIECFFFLCCIFKLCSYIFAQNFAQCYMWYWIGQRNNVLYGVAYLLCLINIKLFSLSMIYVLLQMFWPKSVNCIVQFWFRNKLKNLVMLVKYCLTFFVFISYFKNYLLLKCLGLLIKCNPLF